jgi:hypothetical protein
VFRNPAVNDINVADFYQFWLFVLLMVLSWISMAVVVSVGDAICFEMLGKLAGTVSMCAPKQVLGDSRRRL